MSKNKKPGLGASTRFRFDEVEAMCQLFDTIFRGGSPMAIAQSEGVVTAYGKFKRMQVKLKKEAQSWGQSHACEEATANENG